MSESEKDMYCGIGKIPSGKIRGTPEHCVQTNQIRYYGLELIDEDLLKEAKGKTSSLIKEQLKLKKIEDDAKILIKEVKNLKIILDDDDSKPAHQKKAQKKMDELMVKKETLIKKLKKQKVVVEAIEEQEKQDEKKKKDKKKSGSGSKKSKK